MALPGTTEVRAEHREAIAAAQAADYALLITIQRIAAGHTPGTLSGSLSPEEHDELREAAQALTVAEGRVRRLAEQVAFMEET